MTAKRVHLAYKQGRVWIVYDLLDNPAVLGGEAGPAFDLFRKQTGL